ncbi:Alpha/beta hydrolase family protein [Roseovarius tolerans]|uniref:Alpha/beta hydrolase family protein n=1 Tax=Roseovarius tolerans TaxID=74031 RepID=A0A0L6CXA0_9RHOB|nr:alpha/beta fold hydrolase [Roseovarius tolerans]KNX42098.1 Alpha/beta hydrolase family protein [Roseovarius tolerans]
MRRVLRGLGRLALGLIAVSAVALVLAPREEVAAPAPFEPRKFGEGIGVYLEVVESAYDDIRPDSEKRVIWAGQRETRTPISIVYLHGFSASSQEIRPVPDRLAEAFGANLVYTRFRGHGRTPDAMGEATASDWLEDAAEALALGRATGERVIVIATSTGASIAAVALQEAALRDGVAGLIMVSPNFGINNPVAPLLTLPGARHWLPLLAGQRRSFEPRNPGQAAEWTTEYPSAAVFPMAAIVAHARDLDYTGMTLPALFYYSDADRVVRPDITAEVAARWGGPVTRGTPDLGPEDDPFAHVIAGDIMSPGNTARAIDAMRDWISGVI